MPDIPRLRWGMVGRVLNRKRRNLRHPGGEFGLLPPASPIFRAACLGLLRVTPGWLWDCTHPFVVRYVLSPQGGSRVEQGGRNRCRRSRRQDRTHQNFHPPPDSAGGQDHTTWTRFVAWCMTPRNETAAPGPPVHMQERTPRVVKPSGQDGRNKYIILEFCQDYLCAPLLPWQGEGPLAKQGGMRGASAARRSAAGDSRGEGLALRESGRRRFRFLQSRPRSDAREVLRDQARSQHICL